MGYKKGVFPIAESDTEDDYAKLKQKLQRFIILNKIQGIQNLAVLFKHTCGKNGHLSKEKLQRMFKELQSYQEGDEYNLSEASESEQDESIDM